MLSQEDSRRLALLERQLRRDDPQFCARMEAAGHPPRKRRSPLALIVVALLAWIGALVLGVAGWWIPAAIAALAATLVVGVLVHRCRPPLP